MISNVINIIGITENHELFSLYENYETISSYDEYLMFVKPWSVCDRLLTKAKHFFDNPKNFAIIDRKDFYLAAIGYDDDSISGVDLGEFYE